MAMDIVFIELSKCASMFGLAFFSLLASIPFGLALGLHPLTVIAIGTLSYSVGVMVAIFFGEKIRIWVMNRRKKNTSDEVVQKPNKRLHAIWERYGIWGLGLAGPMTTGSQMGAIFGVMMNAPFYRLIVAMTAGAFMWSIILTLAFMAGIIGIQAVVA